jgi:2-keto-3-deoxy-L-rhamnonate aldolase RhmA
MIFANPLRAKLKQGRATYGMWVTLEAPTVTAMAANAGVEWVCIDMEYGALEYRDVLGHLRGAKGSGVAVLTRAPSLAQARRTARAVRTRASTWSAIGLMAGRLRERMAAVTGTLQTSSWF